MHQPNKSVGPQYLFTLILQKDLPGNLLAERGRFYEIARGSLTEVDTGFDIAVGLGYVNQEGLTVPGEYLARCFQMFSKMIGH